MINEPHSDERELLEKVASGDEQAFTRLFDRYFHVLGTHMFRITRSHELAEEIVQDVFLKIWIAREALLEVKDFQAYLFIVSRNHALNALKKATREEAKFHAFEAGVKREDAHDDPSIQEISEHYYSLLDQAIDRLPTQQKTAFLLSRRQRKKYEEIATEMNVTRETVKKHLQLATRSISEYVRTNIDPSLVALLLASAAELQEFHQVV